MSDEYPPCIGCGYCCMKSLCMLGSIKYGYKTPCPSLVLKDGRYWCGEVLSADDERRPVIERDLAINAGCCSSMNTQRQRQRMYQKMNGVNGFKPLNIVMSGVDLAFIRLVVDDQHPWPSNIPEPEIKGTQVTFFSVMALMDCVNRLSIRGYEGAASRVQDAFISRERDANCAPF